MQFSKGSQILNRTSAGREKRRKAGSRGRRAGEGETLLPSPPSFVFNRGRATKPSIKRDKHNATRRGRESDAERHAAEVRGPTPTGSGWAEVGVDNDDDGAEVESETHPDLSGTGAAVAA